MWQPAATGPGGKHVDNSADSRDVMALITCLTGRQMAQISVQLDSTPELIPTRRKFANYSAERGNPVPAHSSLFISDAALSLLKSFTSAAALSSLILSPIL